MPKALALGLTALAGAVGAILLAPPALPAAPAALAGWAPHNAELQLAGSRQLAMEETASSRAASAHLALRAIDALPYNQGALALASEMGGVADRTQALNIAAALGWRDPLANARLVQLALSEGSTKVAAQRIDALGRTQGGDFAAASADRLMAMVGGPQALAERAGYRSGGRWWITYLRLPASDEASQQGRLAFARSIDRNDGTWLRWIVTAITGSLQGAAANDQAFALWRETLADPSASGSVLYDERLATIGLHTPALGGEWRLHANAPFATEATGDGLQLTRLNGRGGPIMSQVFRAPPGTYRLQADGEPGSERLRWSISCGARQDILASEAALGSWQFSLDEPCRRPVLRLGAEPGGSTGETAFLQRVSIEALSGE